MEHALALLKQGIARAEHNAIYASNHGAHEEAWAYIDEAKELTAAYNALTLLNERNTT